MTGAIRLARARRTAWVCAGVVLAWSSCGRERDTAATRPAVARTYVAAGASLALTLDRTSLTTADDAVLSLAVETAEEDVVTFPDPEGGFGDFDVVSDELVVERLLETGRIERIRKYVLQPFLPGDYELPSLTVTLNGADRISSEAVPIAVASALQDRESAELRDIAPPADVPAPGWWWALGALLLAAAGGAAWWWRRRHRARRDAPPVVLPHETALAALDALLAEELLASGAVAPFYARLSDIVRRYVEGQFSLRAPEQTTEEFLAAISLGPQIRRDHQALLRDFLQRSDMVKFAKVVPGANETSGAVDAARQFIRQTIPAGVATVPETR